MLDEVDPDVGDGPGVADVPDPNDDPVAPEFATASVVPVVPAVPAVPPGAPDVPPGALDEPEDVDAPDELDDELADPPAVSATATPWPVATAVTSQAATARPP